MTSPRDTFVLSLACGLALLASGAAVAAENDPLEPAVAPPAVSTAGAADYREAYAAYAAANGAARAVAPARRAAQAGSAPAAFLLGMMYASGKGVDRNLGEARKWFETAAASGDRAARYNVGVVALEQHDPGAASAAFRAAAEKGLATAQAAYGRDLELGQGVERNEAEAVTWYRMAAEGGDAVGAYHYGGALARGAPGAEKNPAEAARWFQVGANQGIGAAQLALGLLYAEGSGVAKDEAAAAGWFKKAAEAGEPDGMYQYALALGRGLGVAKNVPEAIELYRRLAEAAHPGAMQGLAAGYFSGEGVAANPQLAYYWAALALKFFPANDPRREHTVQLKGVIEKNLSMSEKINLDVRAATFKPKPAAPTLAAPRLLPPPAPVTAPRVETVRQAAPRPGPGDAPSGDAAEESTSPGPGLLHGLMSLRSGPVLPRTGADESGAAPLDPRALPVSPTATAPDGPRGDESGEAPLNPDELPVSPTRLPPPKSAFGEDVKFDN